MSRPQEDEDRPTAPGRGSAPSAAPRFGYTIQPAADGSGANRSYVRSPIRRLIANPISSTSNSIGELVADPVRSTLKTAFAVRDLVFRDREGNSHSPRKRRVVGVRRGDDFAAVEEDRALLEEAINRELDRALLESNGVRLESNDAPAAERGGLRFRGQHATSTSAPTTSGAAAPRAAMAAASTAPLPRPTALDGSDGETRDGETQHHHPSATFQVSVAIEAIDLDLQTVATDSSRSSETNSGLQQSCGAFCLQLVSDLDESEPIPLAGMRRRIPLQSASGCLASPTSSLVSSSCSATFEPVEFACTLSVSDPSSEVLVCLLAPSSTTTSSTSSTTSTSSPERFRQFGVVSVPLERFFAEGSASSGRLPWSRGVEDLEDHRPMETARGPRTDTRLASLLYRFCVKKEFGLILPPRWHTFYPAAYKIGGEAGVGMGKSDVRDPTSWKVKAAFAISSIDATSVAGLYLGKESEKNGLRPWKAEGSVLETLEAAVDTQSRLIQLSEHRFAPFRVFVRLLHWLRASEYQYLQVQHQERGFRIFGNRFLASLLRNTPFFVCYFFLPWTLFPLFTTLFVVAVFAQNRKTNVIHTCCGTVGSPPPSAEDHRHAGGQMTDMLVEDSSYFFSRRFVNVWGNDERAQSSATKKVLPFLKFFGIHRRRDGEPGFDFKRPPFLGPPPTVWLDFGEKVQALLLWDDFVASSVFSVAVILLFGVLPSVFWIAWNYARWGVCELLAPFLIEWLCFGLGRSVAAVWGGGLLAAAQDEHERVAALVAECLKARLTYDFFVRFVLALLHFFVCCTSSFFAVERQLLSRLDPAYEKLRRAPAAGATPYPLDVVTTSSSSPASRFGAFFVEQLKETWSDRLRGFYNRIPTWTDSSRLYLAALQREGVAEGHAWEKYMEFRLEMEATGEGE